MPTTTKNPSPNDIVIPWDGTLFTGAFEGDVRMENSAALVVAQCQKTGRWGMISLDDILNEYRDTKGAAGKYSAPLRKDVLDGLHWLVARRMLRMESIGGVVHLEPTAALLTAIEGFVKPNKS